MTINQQITLDMSDIISMLKDKLKMSKDSDLVNVIITDYNNPDGTDNDGIGEKKAVIPSGLVKKSNIVEALKEGLKGANASHKFPKNAIELCEEAMVDVLKNMSTKESNLFKEIINTDGFTKFSLLWQKYQTNIQNRL